MPELGKQENDSRWRQETPIGLFAYRRAYLDLGVGGSQWAIVNLLLPIVNNPLAYRWQVTIGDRFKFAGGQWDVNLGVYKFGVRLYNPQTGTWMTRDPLGLGPDSNPYRYVSNGPVNWIDPSGRDREDPVLDPRYNRPLEPDPPRVTAPRGPDPRQAGPMPTPPPTGPA